MVNRNLVKKEDITMSERSKIDVKELDTSSIFKDEKKEKEIKIQKKKAVDTKRIASMNKRIERELGINKKKNSPVVNPGVDKYISYLNENRVFQVQFNSCSRKGELSTIDEETGVYIVMSAKATEEGFPYFVAALSHKMLTYIFDVKVVSVEPENNRVYVASSHDARHAELAGRRNLERELKNAIKEKVYPTVWGNVKHVYKDKAIIDIFGANIRGVIMVSHWSKGYVRSLKSVCVEGEFYQFQVTYVTKKVKDKPIQFLLDRRNLSEDPWKSIPKDLFPVGTVCEVKCIELPLGKSFWWGTSELTPGIEIMGDFPSSNEKRLYIFPGMSYMCKVDDVSIDKEGERNRFRVVPFAISDYCRADYEKLVRNLKVKENQLADADMEE